MYHKIFSPPIARAVLCAWAVWLATASAHAIGNYQIGDRLNVLALSGLRLRAQAGPNEQVVANIPYAAKLEVLPQTLRLKSFTVEGIKGHWVKVRYERQEGWVFDGFLSHLPAPTASTDDLLKYAQMYGTPLTPMMTSRVAPGDDAVLTSRVQAFKQTGSKSGGTWCYNSEGYYEAFVEYLCIENAAPEEAWLVAKSIYQNKMNVKFLNRPFEGDTGLYNPGTRFVVSDLDNPEYIGISVTVDPEKKYVCIVVSGGP